MEEDIEDDTGLKGRLPLDEKGANTRKIFSGPEYQNLDIYQVNCTYYSALENNADSYLAARAIQFFCPGIPQVYYVGLLAGSNDMDLFARTKVGRDVNRHYYAPGEVEAELRAEIVTVAGRVHGNILAGHKIELTPSADVRGDITSPRILIREGASFEGQVFMADPNKPKPKAPEAKETPNSDSDKK